MKTIMYDGKKLLPITSDVVFKAIFGNEENKDLLMSLLNSFLEIDIKTPDEIQIVGTEFIKHYGEDKLCRLDIRVKTDDNKHIDIEIQVVDKKDMINRSIYYAACLYTEQMKEGMRYNKIGRTIALNILCYNLFEDNRSYVNSYRFKNRETNSELTDILEINFVELKKVKIQKTSNEDMKDLWAKFLSAESEEELIMLKEKNETLNKAVEKLKYVSADDIIRFEYDQRRKARLDYGSDMACAKEEGMKQGIQKGIEQGIKKGECKKSLMYITKLLTQKFGELPDDYKDKLGKADVEILDMIMENIFEIELLEDINKYLD